MLRSSLITVFAAMAVCGGGIRASVPVASAATLVRDPDAPQSPTREELAAELAVARAGCGRCHAMSAAESRLLPLAGPDLTAAARWHGDDGGASMLRQHHGDADAAELAAWLTQVAADAPPLQAAATTAEAAQRGERLFTELACGACHAPDLLSTLSQRTDHEHVTAFLVDPTAHRPGVAHDFALSSAEAAALAAWLLRAQVVDHDAPPVAGFAFECFELRIEDATLPQLDVLKATASGLCDTIDVAPRTRDNHFALRFQATLTVPTSGEWTFIAGSDDCSWLWIDDELIIENAAIAPHRRRSGKVRLDAGPHALRVVYTEAAGGESLEVLWRGPGTDEQPIPAAVASAT
ncbi:MAG: hypothetical protein KDC98_00695, partial [Planctomycetes bacterium]|nr:hypothetical protein [Planctomycetota bacterium]